MDKYDDPYARMEAYCEKLLFLFGASVKSLRKKEERKQMQIQEIDLFLNQDSSGCIMYVCGKMGFNFTRTL